MGQPEDKIEGLVRLEKGGEMLLTPYVNPRRIGMKIVSNQELQDIGSATAETALYFTLLGIAAGGLIASIAVLTTVEMINPFAWAGWLLGLIVTGIGTLSCGALAYFSWRKGQKRIDLIEKESAAREIELLR